MKSTTKKRLPYPTLLRHIATILEAPRDRLGRLDMWNNSDGKCSARRDSVEVIRALAVSNNLPGSHDRMEQVAKVIRVHVGE